MFALAACAATALGTAWGQVQPPEDIGLRQSVVPSGGARTATKAKKSDAAQATYGSPPGSGAGETGFISTNVPAATAARSQPAPSTTASVPASASAKSAARKSKQRPENEQTASLRTATDEAEPYSPIGLRVGSFDVISTADISYGYDDNPFRTATPEGSQFARAEARVEARSNWTRHELSGELRGSYTDYLQISGNNRPEGQARLRGRIDMSSVNHFELAGSAGIDTIPAGSPDSVTSAKEPPLVYTYTGSAAYVHRFNRLEFTLRGNIERSTYGEAELISGGVESLADRDYTAYGPSLRGSYEMTPDFKPFLQVSADRREYDQKIDAGGVERSSRGMQALAGIEFGKRGILTGEVSAGWATRRYDDPALQEIAGFVFDSSLVWRATPLTTVRLNAKSEIGETTLEGASGVFVHEATLRIDHAFRRWLIGSASVTYGINDYDGTERRDDVLGLSASLTYYLNRYAALRGEVRREQLRSTAPGQDYTANIVFVGLRLQR